MTTLKSDKKALNFLLDWQKKRILDNKNIIELLSYKDNSLWWFLHSYLYNFIVSSIDQIKDKQVEKTKTPSILYLNIFRFWQGIYRKVKSKPLEGIPSKCDVIIVSPSRFWLEGVDQDGIKIKHDIIFNATLNQLQSKHKTLLLDVEYKNKANIKVMQDKIKSGWIPFEYFYSTKNYFKALKEIKEIKVMWKKLKRNNQFKNSLKYHKINLWRLLQHRFKEIFSYFYLYNDIYNVQVAKNILKAVQPKVILLSLETLRYGRAFIIAANELGIPSIGVQHGLITETSNTYIHHKKYRPQLPTVTAIYGEYTRKILVEKSCYKKNEVAVTGQPRYDTLFCVKEIYNRGAFAKEQGLNQTKKFAAIIMQTLSGKKERTEFLTLILNTLKEFKNIEVIIKPKPVDNSAWIDQLAKETGCKVTILSSTSDIFELTYCCDMLLTAFSTSALEAMMLGKPAIIINPCYAQSQIPYVKSGAALEAKTKDELAQIIKKLTHRELDTTLKSNMKKFVREHIHTFDGKSTERFISLVERVMRDE